MWIGCSTAQQVNERTSKRSIFPRVNDWIHARICHGQWKCRLIINRWTICSKLKDLRTGDYKIWQPANRKASQNQYNHLQRKQKHFNLNKKKYIHKHFTGTYVIQKQSHKLNSVNEIEFSMLLSKKYFIFRSHRLRFVCFPMMQSNRI